MDVKRTRIKEAVASYNQNKPAKAEKMTMQSLAKAVIADKISDSQKRWKFSQWNQGHTAIPSNYLVAISEKTGVSICFLLGIDEKKC